MELIIWFICLSGLVSFGSSLGCHRAATGPPIEWLISPRSHEYIQKGELPTAFDWGNVNGVAYTTPIRNQQLPRLCGSCWAHGSLSALSDRLRILGRLAVPDVILAPQVLLNLVDLAPQAGGCNGGDHNLAYEFVRLNHITDESCSPYEGVDYATWGEHINASHRMCRVCEWTGTCKFTERGPRYGIVEHGVVLGEVQMKAEIFARGPISCSIFAHGAPHAFNDYTGSPEIFLDDTVYNETSHVIAIQGWGEEIMPHWVGRNSYGTLWGLKGFFKLRRGRDDLKIETSVCTWAVPFEVGSRHTSSRLHNLPEAIVAARLRGSIEAPGPMVLATGSAPGVGLVPTSIFQ